MKYFSLLTFITTILFLNNAYADYWADYRTCLQNNLPANQLHCTDIIITRQRAAVQNLASDLSGLAVNVRCQDTTTNRIFLGNGMIVDALTCGARGDSTPGCTSIFSSSGETREAVSTCASPVPASTPGGPVIEWCQECQSGGCAACGARGDVSAQAASSISRSVDKLLQCFAPSGKFPQNRLRSKVIRTYTELASEGTTLQCPNQDVTRAALGEFTAGRANRAERRIQIFPTGMGDTGTFGHEFLHMCGDVDNQNAHTHNHPFDNHSYVGSGSGAGTANPTVNSLGLPNRYFDSVYSCEALCFESELISKEQCELCMDYGTSAGSERTAKRRPCQNMLTRQQLSDWMRVRRHADEEIRDMCRSQTTSVFNAWTGQLQSAITGMRGSRISATDIYFIDFNNSDPMRRTSIAGLPSGSTVSTSAVGESTPAERDAAAAASPSLGPARVPYANPTWSTISSRCQNSITAATDQLDTMIAREVTRSNTASNRNLAELRNERRRYDMEKRIFEFKNLCQRLSVYRLAQQACSHAADASTYPRESRALCSSSFRTGYPEIQSALTDLQAAIAGTPDRQGWNQLATQNTLDAITAQGQPISDEIYMPETIALPAAISLSGSQTFCNSLPTQAQHVTLITSGN